MLKIWNRPHLKYSLFIPRLYFVSFYSEIQHKNTKCYTNPNRLTISCIRGNYLQIISFIEIPIIQIAFILDFSFPSPYKPIKCIAFFWNVTNSTAICGLPQLILSNKLFFHRLMYRIRNGLKLPCIGVVKKRIFYLYMGMQVVIWPHQRFSCAMLSFKMDSTTSLWSIMDQLAEPPVTFH